MKSVSREDLARMITIEEVETREVRRGGVDRSYPRK